MDLNTKEIWVCRESRSRPGMKYYFNKRTGHTRWTLPPCSDTKLCNQLSCTPLGKRKNIDEQKEPARKHMRQDPHVTHVFKSSKINPVEETEVQTADSGPLKYKHQSNTSSQHNTVVSETPESASTKKSSIKPATSTALVNVTKSDGCKLNDGSKQQFKKRKKKKKKTSNSTFKTEIIAKQVPELTELHFPVHQKLSATTIFNNCDDVKMTIPAPDKIIQKGMETKGHVPKMNLAESRMKHLQKILSVSKESIDNSKESSQKKLTVCRSTVSSAPSQACRMPTLTPISGKKTCEEAKECASSNVTGKFQIHPSEISTQSKDCSPPPSLTKEICPAASRLKRLQNEIYSKQKASRVSSDALLDSTASNLPRTNCALLAPHKLKEYKTDKQETSEFKSIPKVLLPAESHCLDDQESECMEVEYPELNVLNEVNEFRKTDLHKINHQPSFMEWDWEADSQVSENKPFYVVLDTNVLLSNLKTIEGLRDSQISGMGPVTLYLPWQVIQELDNIKNHGKSTLKPLARQAIKFLNDNFSSKHPRVRGQKYISVKKDLECPDDSILQACLDLQNPGYDVILFSNDKNLCNKALINGIQAGSKDEVLKKLSVSELTSKETNAKLTNKVTSYDEKGASFADAVLCELKSNIKCFLSQVVSFGMEKEFGVLWRKRTIIPPPWEADDALRCLSQHWLSICGDFGRHQSDRQHADKLLEFLKFKTKRYGVVLASIQDAIESTLALYNSLPGKYEDLLNSGKRQLKDLILKIKHNQSTCANDIASKAEGPGPKAASSPSLIRENSSEGRPFAVLSCFERVLSAVTELCNSKCEVEDGTWKELAAEMIKPVRLLIQYMQSLLSVPGENLFKQNSAVVQLWQLIKGDSDITVDNIVSFCQAENTRTLMMNGLQQFIYLENVLRSSGA